MVEDFPNIPANHSGRSRNMRLVLHELRLRGNLSRAELSRATSLTPPAIAAIVQELMQSGMVREAGRRKSIRGQPPIGIEIDKDGGYAIGLRVEWGSYDFVVSDLGGHVIASGMGEVPCDETDELLDFLVGLYNGLASTYGRDRSLGLGLVTPGPFDSEWPGIPTPGAVPALQTRSLIPVLSDRLGVDVFLENDATAAALGERLNGVAREKSNFFYVYIGEGVGGGIVVGNVPYRGINGNAGEFGHMIVDPKGPKCFCGNHGCLGQYLSLSSLRRMQRQNASKPALIVEAEWLVEATVALSIALATIENLLDPEMIVVGGIAPQALLIRIIEGVGQLRPSVRIGQSGERLMMSGLGQQSASYGAAALPIIAATSPG